MPKTEPKEQPKDERQIDLVDNPPERRGNERGVGEVTSEGEMRIGHLASEADHVAILEKRQMAQAPQRQLAAVTPADLLQIAVQGGADIEKLEKLMELQMRWEADQARKAFADDMARFKSKSIEIIKDKHVDFQTSKGRTQYDHATIGNVVQTIVPALAEFGFAHRWDVTQAAGRVSVECVITHRMGHEQRTKLEAGHDESGGKNSIQSIISTKTYLERHTLLAATGLATKDQADDDGLAAGLDTTRADKWMMKADAATTLDALEAVWTEGVAEISKAQDMAAYKEFKAKVGERKVELAGAK